MAVVILGGLTSATLLHLLIIPTLFSRFNQLQSEPPRGPHA